MSDFLSWRLSDFPFQTDIPTRWGDNDMLGHLNNVVYNRMIETVVVRFTMGPLEIDWQSAPSYPLVVESLCRFHRPLSFPETITAGLRAGRIGGTSVTYEIALFGEGDQVPASTGHFVHVFIDRDTHRSVEIPASIRALIETHGLVS
jgi:acyl-CoA thioester hydrolase